MPSKLHHDLLVEAINDYLKRGYKLLMLNHSLTEDYRPDAVVENEQEIVIIEVVVTSDKVQKVEDLQTLFPKTLRIDKRVGRKNRRGHKNKRVGRKTSGSKKIPTIVIVGEDGRVTLPSEIRRALKIEVGDRVLWTLEGDKRACIKKV